ncbi:hypothetical protein [Solimonas sp. SE-A11]|uniref:hypothetical protein n=1 Tax=Solimonas sp. SE-A11 TaxID=3054954 RepID=UPI00259C78EB|nr:hypothetical protein [Solimonas sp. SE-A11]MDM4770881.1 hypothetical protein [Solimonas sp. SE-A11]
MSIETKPASPAAAPLMELVEAPGLFADALLTDERGGLLFISLWGRDTAVQEFLARLSVDVSEGGLRTLHVEGPAGRVQVHFDRMPSLEKHTGRLPPRNLFGDLVQLWIHDKLATEPDRANRRALLLHRPRLSRHDATDACLWGLVREVCHIPLLEGWRQPVLTLLELHGWLTPIPGIGIDAWRLELGNPRLDAEISQMIRGGVLQLSGNAAQGGMARLA